MQCLAATDVGYAVVLYLWLMVGLLWKVLYEVLQRVLLCSILTLAACDSGMYP
jgi:hypothetical protein